MIPSCPWRGILRFFSIFVLSEGKCYNRADVSGYLPAGTQKTRFLQSGLFADTSDHTKGL